MKGDSKLIWIIIGLIIAIAVLALVLGPLIQGQHGIILALGEAHLKGCCNNYMASSNKAEVMCAVPIEADSDNDRNGFMNIGDLCLKVRGMGNCDPCS